MKIINNITEAIGNTPLVKINKLQTSNNQILAKIESFNPSGSTKERVALNMILQAENAGLINEKSTIIEPTSGNTGIGLATIAAVKNYRLILVMPESMSIERRKLITQLGAEIVLTPASEGMKGSIAKANELAATIPNAFLTKQFENPANPQAHYLTTAPEIWRDTNGEIDFFVAGIGTGGTISGCGKYLKEKNPAIKIIGVEPTKSSVISGGSPGPHLIQGIGAGFIPKNLDTTMLNQVITIDDEIAIETARELARKEGLICGISSGAAMAAAIKIAQNPENKNKNIVVILPDTGERYLSTKLFE